MTEKNMLIEDLTKSLDTLELLLGLKLTVKEGELGYLNIIKVAQFLKREYKEMSVKERTKTKEDIQKIVSAILMTSNTIYSNNKRLIDFSVIGNPRPLLDAVMCLEVITTTASIKKLAVDYLIGSTIAMEKSKVTIKQDIVYRMVRCLFLLCLLEETVALPAMALSVQLVLEDGTGVIPKKQSFRESSTVLQEAVIQLKNKFSAPRNNQAERVGVQRPTPRVNQAPVFDRAQPVAPAPNEPLRNEPSNQIKVGSRRTTSPVTQVHMEVERKPSHPYTQEQQVRRSTNIPKPQPRRQEPKVVAMSPQYNTGEQQRRTPNISGTNYGQINVQSQNNSAMVNNPTRPQRRTIDNNSEETKVQNNNQQPVRRRVPDSSNNSGISSVKGFKL